MLSPIPAACAVVPAALLLLVAGCGLDPSHAPVDADRADFCKSWNRLAKADAGTSKDDLHDYLNEFARYGTPRGIPTAARNGFEYLIDPDRGFTNVTQVAELATRTDGAGADAKALVEYAGKTCAG